MTKYEQMADRFYKSGLSIDVFARQAGIKESTLRYYLRQAKEIQASEKDNGSEPEFMAISLPSSALGGREITITMPSGIIIRVPVC